MKNKTLIFILSFCLIMAAFPATGFSNGGSPVLAWEGFVSDQTTELIKIVDNPEEWAGLWRRVFDQPAPEVDFTIHVVACVFLGHAADWLFGIHFGEPFLRDNRMVIPYTMHEMILELAGPFKAGGQYKMQVFEKAKDVPMVLEKQENVGGW